VAGLDTAAVPHSAAGVHEFDAAAGKGAGVTVGVDIVDDALGHVADRGDARMGVQFAPKFRPLIVDEVEKDERLQETPEV
jgi:hypothetical protein